jgi:hypothetical protein
MQEVLELFSTDEEEDSDVNEQMSGDHHLFLTLSLAIVSGLPSPKTLCLSGTLQGKHVRMLVDLGSSHSFVSETVAVAFEGIVPLANTLHVQVANGNKLHVPLIYPMLPGQWILMSFTLTSRSSSWLHMMLCLVWTG